MSTSLTRRNFLEWTSAAGTAALLLSTLEGCTGSGSVAGSTMSSNGQASLTFAMYPALMNVGDGVVVNVDNTPIAVLRTGATSASALSAVCTHQGCTLEVQSGSTPLFCPCHGSEFDANGNPVAGPARSRLRVYQASVDATGVTVTLG